MAYCTEADLALSVGGSANLVRLLDKNRDAVADADMVEACLTRASSEVDSALQLRHSLPLTFPAPAILTTHTAALAAYYAHALGTDGQGIPQFIRTAADDARTFLTDLAEGRRSLGVAAKPASDLEAKQVDPDPNGTKVSRTSLRGFW